MGNLIFGLILAIIIFVAMGFVGGFLKSGKRRTEFIMTPLMLLAVIGILFCIPAFVYSVPVNNVGIAYNPFTGGTSETTLSEGYGIEFVSISIMDMDAGDEIEEAITAEAVAKKEVETVQQELLKTQTQAQKLAVQAQAEQDAAKIEAETLIIQAEAEKKANELKNASLSDLILEQLWIEKWNGIVPTYYGGTGADLIFNTGTTNNSTASSSYSNTSTGTKGAGTETVEQTNE